MSNKINENENKHCLEHKIEKILTNTIVYDYANANSH